MTNEVHLYWRDEDGEESRSTWYTDETDPANLADLVADLVAVSEAALYRYGILLKGEPAVAITPSAGPYDVADKATFVFSTNLGNTVKVTVPAPLSTVFSDSDNVNLANGGVVAFAAAIKAVYESIAGETLVDLLYGYRTRSTRRV